MTKQEADALADNLVDELLDNGLIMKCSKSSVVDAISAAILKTSEDGRREVLDRLPSEVDLEDIAYGMGQRLFLDLRKSDNDPQKHMLIAVHAIGARYMYQYLRDRLTNGEAK